jgi:hypothetical protein
MVSARATRTDTDVDNATLDEEDEDSCAVAGFDAA